MTRILVVDDDALVREVLTLRLSREGFQITGASNGVQTIALARAEQPGLILLAIDLPMLNGWQVAQRLRAIPETRTIPIIALISASPADLSAQIAASGCAAYEPKPIRFPELIAKIRWLVHTSHDSGLYTREAGAG